ncbi:HAD family hydrolase [Vibrio sonorensis]|uniref:HAD family hydrolase n=1 Tax=Vibrio sonorensis TaxID=1004316 RepID=UPI0008DB03C0|nr:HAD family phosphatase [Vibrio sonorensis]
MTIKAILFDMDGVLIEAKEWHYEALNQALELFGMPISRFDHLTTFDGLPTKKKLELLSAERDLPSELHGFINEMKQQYTMEIVHTHCKPVFVHEYALSNLKAEGYKLAVCSNSIRNTVVTMMEKSALSDYLELMVSNEDVSNGKPDPEMYLKAMSELGLKPEECLIVEDNENGIKAAKASGGHLLVVKDVADTNYLNIVERIKEIESQHGEVI